ncbi:Nucleotidyltransferase domain-containing protein [Thermanaeromonas toyohensis ToBE]|uniref:Nucleotidyltransferase domain-containing protein n=1 Tax=Thermanaeromonas toyohensis ToBE TaxID=698762 RepID=A0A1W1V8R4_9FIRM|nr:nucleotidyltransferase domain-containing protein [Thermanaeromonas toyohensis]SMB89580.1 Nucleotidyltransferase domain-containing protein [Thermanaeromonas toyohensis ToBE]
MQDILELILERIREVADPDKIILFGSRSRGDQDPHSDYDLLVLKSGVSNRRALAQKIYKSLAGIPVSVDIIVETPERVETYREASGFVYREALKGIVVYEKRE